MVGRENDRNNGEIYIFICMFGSMGGREEGRKEMREDEEWL